MNTKRILLTLLAWVAFTFLALAQSNYKSGYILKLNGDTVKGYINYKEWVRNPEYIEFKTAVQDKEPSRFTPDMLRTFEVNGMDKYIGYIGPVSMDKNTFPDLPSALDTTTVLDSVFLRTEYSGSPLSLLVHQDNIKTRLFIQENDGKPEELPFYQYYTDAIKFRTVPLYKTKLIALLQKYNPQSAAVYKLIAANEFNETDITRILKLINNDTEGKSKSTYGGRFFAGALFNRTSTKFDGDNMFKGQSGITYAPQLSAGYDVLLNKYTQKFYFRVELGFTYAKPSFVTVTNQLALPIITKARFDQYTASLTPQYVYNIYNKDAFKVSLGAGIRFNYSFYSNNEITYDKYNTSFINSYKLENFWMSFPVHLGLTVHKKVEILASYTYPASYTRYTNFSISNQTYGLGVHYLFGK